VQIKSRAIVGALVATVVVLVVGAILVWLYHSRISIPMRQANASFLRGDWGLAQAGYEESLNKLKSPSWLGNVLTADYQDALIGNVRTLYATGEYDAALTLLNREADLFPEFGRDPRWLLWAGNLWFRRAVLEEGEIERREGFSTAVDFFRKGLEVAPDDWDLKFNYELTAIILAQEDPLSREKEEDEEENRILPRIRTDQERQRRILPPEERG
jgi:tetratricopeptide (TPR) repeat protein